MESWAGPGNEAKNSAHDRSWLHLWSPEVWFPQSVTCDPEWDGETARQSLAV